MVKNFNGVETNHKTVVNIYIAYKVNLYPFKQSTNITLGNSLFGAVKLIKNVDFDKYKYSAYSIGFDVNGTFSLCNDSGFGKNVIIFGVDMSSFVHIDNKKKYILILGKGPTQELDDIRLTAEKEFIINFSEHRKKFCLSLHYNGVNSYSFINRVEIYKFKAKDFEVNTALLCLGDISKDFSTDNMKNTELYGCL